MIKVNVILNNKNWKKFLKYPKSFIEKKIEILNKKNKISKKKYIFSLVLSDKTEITKLNKKFRKKNKSTDVLSFPFYEKRMLGLKTRKEKEIYLGDVIINLEKIKNKKDQVKFETELNRLWIHGLLHLFGHNHKKNKDFFIMSKIEKKYLNYINVR